MNDLRIIENDLVPVYETSLGNKVVYGTKLHTVLEVKSRYREWIDRRLSDIDAIENKDFQSAEISAPSGQSKKEHIIRLEIAKEIAMLERNEKGKQVRRYFIQVEERYKKQTIDRQQLSPHTQALMALTESIARTELEQKRLSKEVEEVKQNQIAIAETFKRTDNEDNFRDWANKCIAKIAESHKFNKGVQKSEKSA